MPRIPPRASGRLMSINPAFLGHGIYVEHSIQNALTHFASYGGGAPATTPPDQISRLVQAMKDMEVGSVWIQLFSRGTVFDPGAAGEQLLKSVITGLASENIKWAGWGYSSGQSWSSDKILIETFQKNLNMSAFVIDAEPGNKIYPNPSDPTDTDKNLPDLWSTDDFDAFTSWANTTFGTNNLALTTWPILQVQDGLTNPVIK
jgi:hypothetical protein